MGKRGEIMDRTADRIDDLVRRVVLGLFGSAAIQRSPPDEEFGAASTVSAP
jgi:hypothetical protein